MPHSVFNYSSILITYSSQINLRIRVFQLEKFDNLGDSKSYNLTSTTLNYILRNRKNLIKIIQSFLHSNVLKIHPAAEITIQENVHGNN